MNDLHALVLFSKATSLVAAPCQGPTSHSRVNKLLTTSISRERGLRPSHDMYCRSGALKPFLIYSALVSNFPLFLPFPFLPPSPAAHHNLCVARPHPSRFVPVRKPPGTAFRFWPFSIVKMCFYKIAEHCRGCFAFRVFVMAGQNPTRHSAAQAEGLACEDEITAEWSKVFDCPNPLCPLYVEKSVYSLATLQAKYKNTGMVSSPPITIRSRRHHVDRLLRHVLMSFQSATSKEQVSTDPGSMAVPTTPVQGNILAGPSGTLEPSVSLGIDVSQASQQPQLIIHPIHRAFSRATRTRPTVAAMKTSPVTMLPLR